MADSHELPSLPPITAEVEPMFDYVTLDSRYRVPTTSPLWERSSTSALRDQGRLFNAATVLTLTLGVLCMYLVVFVADVLVAEVFIDGDLLRSKLRHSIGLGDYLTLAWVVTAAATIGGALGSGLESTEAVRDAAYGRRDDRSEDE